MISTILYCTKKLGTTILVLMVFLLAAKAVPAQKNNLKKITPCTIDISNDIYKSSYQTPFNFQAYANWKCTFSLGVELSFNGAEFDVEDFSGHSINQTHYVGARYFPFGKESAEIKYKSKSPASRTVACPQWSKRRISLFKLLKRGVFVGGGIVKDQTTVTLIPDAELNAFFEEYNAEYTNNGFAFEVGYKFKYQCSRSSKWYQGVHPLEFVSLTIAYGASITKTEVVTDELQVLSSPQKSATSFFQFNLNHSMKILVGVTIPLKNNQ